MTCPLDASSGELVPLPEDRWWLDARDAADMNAAVELPEQPVYDWTGVVDEEGEAA